MSEIKRAVIMAAGFGSRLRPLTLATPKPLIRVQGKVIIERMIEALLQNGMEEIVVVVGYKKEAFAYLAERYREVSLVENPYYDSCNNISSLYAAREFLCSAVVAEADLIVENSGIFENSVDLSGYLAVRNPHPAEWSLKTENGIIMACSMEGGAGDHQLLGISKWNESDGEKLKNLAVDYFEKRKIRDIYWDQIPLFLEKDQFTMRVYEISPQDVTEIDTPEDLIKLDRSYTDYFKEVRQ